MNWLDWVIVIIFAVLVFLGFRKGFVQQFFDLLGSVVALVTAFCLYRKFGDFLSNRFSLSMPTGNVLAFILIMIVIGGSVAFIGSRWRNSNKAKTIAIADSFLGALVGGIKAIILIMLILLSLLTVKWDFVQTPIEDSQLAEDVLRLMPFFVQLQENALPSEMPKVIISPDGVKWRNFDYEKLGLATCFACGSKVEYRGLVRSGLLEYPQVVCRKCHRVSDGCLTFEGYHMLYQTCPYEKFGAEGLTDCKVWSNPEMSGVHGRCTVCRRTK